MTKPIDIIRENFAKLTEAEACMVLGWLLDTGIADPAPIQSDEVTDALLPLRAAYDKQFDEIQWALDQIEPVTPFWGNEPLSAAELGIETGRRK